MKQIYKTISLTVFVWLMACNSARASHIMGSDLSYVCNGNNSYTVTLKIYRDCCGIDVDNTYPIEVYNACTGGSNTFNVTLQNAGGTEVSELCPAQLAQSVCSGSVACPANPNGSPATYPGVKMYIYTHTYTLTSACDSFYFRTSTCCRNNVMNVPPNGFGIQAMVNNTINPLTGSPYCNSSVVFSTLPVPFVCLNSQVTFNNGAVDANGDSLVFELANPLDDSYNPLPFNGGWNINRPIPNSGVTGGSFSFVDSTGQIEFVSPNQEIDVLAMRVKEYRNGVLIGTTIRDIQITVLPCAISIPFEDSIANVGNGIQQSQITVKTCPGTPLSFDIQCTDQANHNITVTSNINGNPDMPGAQMVQVGTGNSVTAHITWTPLAADTGCHGFVLTTKNDDCPINGSYTRAYEVCVLNKVQFLDDSLTFCGRPIRLDATGGTNFIWTPSTGPNAVSDINSYHPFVSPVSPTMYYFSSDCGTDSIYIDVNPAFVFDAGLGGSICRNGQVNLNATVDNLYAPYHFKWEPSTGLFDPISGLPSDSIRNPVASPNSTTQYTCTFVGANNCPNSDSLIVTVVGAGPNIIAKAQPTLVCPGDVVNLSVDATPQQCGISSTPCVGHIITGRVGTDSSSTSVTNTPTTYPTIYGHYQNSARHQFLYLQAELMAQLGKAGAIDSISFFLVKVNNLPDTMKNFEIQMACTQSPAFPIDMNAANPWEHQNLVTVFSSKNVVLPIVNGWVTHKLDFPYDWDGTSNLVVDICFENPGTSALNKKMMMTPTAFSSVCYSYGTNKQCGNTNSPQLTNKRPNAKFNVCVTDIDNLPVTWTPNSGPNAALPSNILTPTAHPEVPGVYTVDVTAQNGCHTQDFVYVGVDTSLLVHAFPKDTFLCSSHPLNITTSFTGSPLPGNSFTYEWRDLATNTVVGNAATLSITPTATSAYLVTLNGGLCSAYDTVHIVFDNHLPLTLRVDSISCFGQTDGKVVAVASGGTPPLTYIWSTGAGIDSIQNQGVGNYSVSVSDFEGCSGTGSATLTEPQQISLVLDTTNITCFGANNGSVLATATGGIGSLTYNWTPGGNVNPLTSMGPGTYTVVVTDANQCTAQKSWTPVEPLLLSVTVATTDVSCFGGTDGGATATVTNGNPAYTFAWSNIATTSNPATGFAKGNQSITVTDAQTCTATASFTISEPTQLNVSVTSSSNVKCNAGADGSINITANGGTANYTYQWSNSTTAEDLANATAGNYIVTVTDSKNCIATVTATLIEPTAITLSFTQVDPLCTGNANGNASVTTAGGTPGYVYDWAVVPGTNDNSSINNLAAGIYDVVVQDINLCSIQGSVTLTNPPSLNAQLINKKEISCANAQDGSIEASVNGGTPPIVFSWSNNFTTSVINNLAPGTYIVTVADANGCDTLLTTTFTAPPLIDIAVLAIDSVTCPQYSDAAIHIVGTGGTPGNPVAYEYSTDGITFQPSELFESLSAGSYHLYIRDTQGCMKDTTVMVYEPVKPRLVVLPQDSMIDLGMSITLVSNLSDYTSADINFYSWSPILGLNCADCASVIATPYANTSYNLTVNYLHDCSVSQTVTILVGNGEDFFVPNAFSPNGDGNNDVLVIYGSGLAKANMKIFNRWGEKIFDSQNQWLGWDGTYKGEIQNSGVYTYYLEGVYLNGKKREKKGTINLIR